MKEKQDKEKGCNMTSQAEVIPGVSLAEYQGWLSNPVTRRIYEHLEQQSRPLFLEELQADKAAYRLGYVTGTWAGLDRPRTLMHQLPVDELPNPEYS